MTYSEGDPRRAWDQWRREAGDPTAQAWKEGALVWVQSTGSRVCTCAGPWGEVTEAGFKLALKASADWLDTAAPGTLGD